MSWQTIFLFFPLFVSFTICFVTTPLIAELSKRLKLIDDPKSHKHPAQLLTKPTPRGGGVSLFLAIFLTAVFFLPIDTKLLAILGAAFLITFVGIVDDRSDINLHPYLRLAAQLAAAMVLVAAGIGVTFITDPLTGGVVDLTKTTLSFNFFGKESGILVIPALFTLFWIPFLMNAVNWSSGVDGQLSGFAAIAALTIAILSLRFSADITQWPVTILAGAVAGAYFGFLPWHKYPQKIMPGFAGSTLAGFMLGVLSILSTTKVGTLLVVLGIPVADALITGGRRIASGKSPFWGDRSHLHHRLLGIGWTKSKVAKFYWLTTGVLGFIALNLNTQYKLYTIIGVALFVGGLVLWLIFLSRSLKAQDQSSG